MGEQHGASITFRHACQILFSAIIQLMKPNLVSTWPFELVHEAEDRCRLFASLFTGLEQSRLYRPPIVHHYRASAVQDEPADFDRITEGGDDCISEQIRPVGLVSDVA